MKLIQLVLEFLKDDSWPNGVKYIVQDRDASIWGFIQQKPFMSESDWWDSDDCDFIQLADVRSRPVAEDYKTTIISQEDYLAALGETPVELDSVEPSSLKIFDDEAATGFTNEFYYYFQDKYGKQVRAIQEELKRDMARGINSLAIIEMVDNELKTTRLMHNFAKD